ncbi:hypothetical protein D3C81_2217150 [compost metagenome]
MLAKSIESFAFVGFLEHIRLAVLVAYALLRVFVDDIPVFIQMFDPERTLVDKYRYVVSL